jgi:hypothetical protein
MKKPIALADCVKFDFADRVFHAADSENWGFITGIYFYPGEVKYLVQWGVSSSLHYEFELTKEKPLE